MDSYDNQYIYDIHDIRDILHSHGIHDFRDIRDIHDTHEILNAGHYTPVPACDKENDIVMFVKKCPKHILTDDKNALSLENIFLC